MPLQNVKLVVCDMDGTLLNSNHEVSDSFFKLHKQLKAKNIHFVAASGRQYHSIVEKLKPIKNDISIIAENGGVLCFNNTFKVFNPLSKTHIQNIVEQARSIKHVEIIVCGKTKAYLESKNQYFIETVKEYYPEQKIVTDVTKHLNEEEEILKIALYHPKSSEIYLYPEFKSLSKQLILKVSGMHWLDISSLENNKGNTLSQLQQSLNITNAETVAIGDYTNDIEMLAQVEFSYAMENAHESVKNTAKYYTTSNDNFGVENVLKDILNSIH